MRLAETVTFGGSSLDRRADLRGQTSTLETAAASAAHLAFWRGKPLVDTDMRLKRLRSDDPLLAFGGEARMLLGEDNATLMFAHDVSAWDPPAGVDDAVGGLFDPSRQAVAEHPGAAQFCDLRSVMADLAPRDAELAATAKAILGWHASHGFCAQCGHRTRPAEAGWRRDCPACGAQHFPRTDPVVIMLITNGNSVLLGRSPGWPEGMYSLLAGFVEPGETVEAAVRREVLEESGVSVGRVDYLASQPWAFPSSLMIGCRGEALTCDLRIDPDELEDALWMTREEVLEVFEGDHPRVRRPRRGAIAGFILEHWLKDRLD